MADASLVGEHPAADAVDAAEGYAIVRATWRPCWGAGTR